VIAFGCATTDERSFRANAATAIGAVAERDSLLMRRHRTTSSLDGAYNEMIATAAERDDLEGLVLVHQDLGIEDGQFLARLRALLAAVPNVAIVGATRAGSPREVEAVGGDLIALSPWACSELRVDPKLSGSLDASVADLCLTARAADRPVLAAAFRAFRDPTPGGPIPSNPPRRRRRVAARASLLRKWE